MTRKKFRMLAQILIVMLLFIQQAPAQTPILPNETPQKLEPTNYGFDYVRREVMIPMRDGVKLHTVILIPKGAKDAPILLTRTPYNATELTTHTQSSHLGPSLYGYDNATDVIVEGVYRPQAIEQMPMETQVALAVPEANGRLTIYSCTQAMYFSMGVVAAHLEVPLNKLKFVGGTVGGGFGGKVDTASDTICALLALKARRAVKWRWTREEEFLASSTRAPWHIEIADAVTSDGWILGRRMLTLHDSGAYARFSPYGVTKHAFHHSGAYTIPNLRFDGFVCFTNRVPTTAMRGFGVTSVSFAVETHLTRIANVLGIDPWQLRLRNANRIGDTSGNGVVMKDPSTVAVALAAAERVGIELPAEYRQMTSEARSGDLLPEHLVAQQRLNGEGA